MISLCTGSFQSVVYGVQVVHNLYMYMHTLTALDMAHCDCPRFEVDIVDCQALVSELEVPSAREHRLALLLFAHLACKLFSK